MAAELAQLSGQAQQLWNETLTSTRAAIATSPTSLLAQSSRARGERRNDATQVNVGIVVDLGAALATMGGGGSRPLAAELVGEVPALTPAPIVAEVVPSSGGTAPSESHKLAPAGSTPAPATNSPAMPDGLGLVAGGGGEIWTDD